ncbi:MAG: GAP family protein [Candidatus Nanopelagicales bacterium]|nr:GAP family protein [Candidatus Nanopelagicales bacterium]
MLNTLLRVLPFAIGATISPTGLLFVMMILSGKDNPRKKALSFVSGATLFLAVLGIFIFLTYKPVATASGHPEALSDAVNIFLGLLLAAIVVKSVFFKKKAAPDGAKKHHRPYLVIGFVYMFINISTWIPFIVAMKIIASEKIGPWDSFPLVLIVIAITMLLVALPVVVTYSMPKKSERILGPINTFMSKYGTRIADVYFTLMAIFLIFIGVRGLLSL